MSLEVWSTIFSGATFVVITATAIAAIIQLRHLRSSNQLAALLTLMQMWNAPELHRQIHYLRTEVPEKIKDPKFLAALATGETARAEHPELMIADFWEQIGSLMKYGLIDENSWLDNASAQIVRTWNELRPVIDAIRSRTGPSSFENFEYAAVRARLWIDKFPHGTYPRDLPRMADLEKRAQS